MSKKKRVQIVAVAFLLIAAILLIPNTDWQESTSIPGFISLIFGTLGSIISIFIPTSYIFYFKEDNWTNNSDGFRLHIKAKKHGCGNSPQVDLFYKYDLNYVKVMISAAHDEKGNVTIGGSRPCIGKVVIS